MLIRTNNHIFFLNRSDAKEYVKDVGSKIADKGYGKLILSILLIFHLIFIQMFA